MNKVWLKGLSDEEQAILKGAAGEGRPVLEKLMTILDEYVEDSIDAMGKDEWFKGNWAEKQATLVGQIKTYKKIHKLINSLLTNE